MHADIEMDRGEVHRFLEFLRIFVVDRLVLFIEQRALAITLEDIAEIPAVAMIVGELRVFEGGVEFGYFLREFGVTPQAANRSLFRIAIENLARFGIGRILLFLWPHGRRVGLVIPHGGAIEAIDEHIGLVHVAHHALRRGDGAGEFMLERMPRLIFRDGRVDALRFSFVTEFGVGARAGRVAVVGVNGVAGGAA